MNKEKEIFKTIVRKAAKEKEPTQWNKVVSICQCFDIAVFTWFICQYFDKHDQHQFL